MPLVRCGLLSRPRLFPLVGAMALASALLLPTACSDDQPTEPVADKHPPLTNEASSGFFRDNFTDVDGTRILDHTPDGGSEPFSWVRSATPGEAVAIIQDNGLLADVSNQGFYLPSRPTGDWVELTLDVGPGASTVFHDVIIYLRTSETLRTADGAYPAYEVRWSIGPEPANWLYVFSYETGSAMRQSVHAPPGLHTLRAEISGGTMQVSVDGQVLLTHPLGPLLPPDRTAIGIWANGSPSVKITSFTAGAGAVRIEPVNGSLDVWPSGLSKSGASGPNELQLRVRVDSSGKNLEDKWVKLALAAVDSSATALDSLYGHHHQGAGGAAKPTGELSADSVNTGSDGLQGLVRYTSSVVSSPVMMIGEISGSKPDSVAIRVGVLGLDSLVPGATFDTIIGDGASHWPNNWVTPGMKSLLLKLASDFRAKHSRKLGFNDASLRFGGKLDLRHQWGDNDPGCVFTDKNGVRRILLDGCHQRHRVGLDLDLRIRDLSQTQQNDIRVMWPELTKKRVAKTTVGVEGDHFHLAYRP